MPIAGYKHSLGSGNGTDWFGEWPPQKPRHGENIFGIPNFFSKPILGATPDIIVGAHFLVVAAAVSCVLRVFSRRRSKARFLWDDGCAVAAAGFLVANAAIFIEFTYLGTVSFSFFGRAMSAREEALRRANIVAGLKLSLAFEVLYLFGYPPPLPVPPPGRDANGCVVHRMFLVKFSMLFLYDRFA